MGEETVPGGSSQRSSITPASWVYLILLLLAAILFAIFVYPRSLVGDIKAAQEAAMDDEEPEFLYDSGGQTDSAPIVED